ncbi:MAG: hypothetical protein IJA60_00205 [Clostridia bacterium]|nr:hypothetical protein [Clostridia bacterium]
MATKEIVMEDDTPMLAAIRYFMLAAVSLVGVGIVNIVLPVWVRVFTGRGAMTLTDRGIEDTFVIFNLLAFWTTLRIRLVPWEAVDCDAITPELIKVDVSKIPGKSAGIVAKLMLRIGGFNPYIGKTDVNELMALKLIVSKSEYNERICQ